MRASVQSPSAKAVLTVVLGLLATGILLVPLSSLWVFEDGHIYEVRFPVYSGTSVSLTAHSHDIRHPVLQKLQGELNFDTDNVGYQWASTIPRILTMVVAFVILYQLRQICASVARDRIFGPESVRRIRVMGIATICGAAAHLAMGVALLHFLRSNFSLEGGQLHIKTQQMLDVSALFLGLVILGLAEIFRYGGELRDDQAFTV